MVIGGLAVLRVSGGLTESYADGEGLRVARDEVWVIRRKAIQSFRLWLHSGLRQQGRAFGQRCKPKAKALGYLEEIVHSACKVGFPASSGSLTAR
jgi:hypothetical protein